jgi:hypothetical protein
MYKIKVTYAGGHSDVAQCDTEAQAREVVSDATLRVIAGLDVTDVAAWQE